MARIPNYMTKAEIYIANHNYPSAIELLNEVIQTQPSLDSYSARGYAYFMLKQYKKAESDLSKALVFLNRLKSPEERSVFDINYYRALSMSKQGRVHEALQAIQPLETSLRSLEFRERYKDLIQSLKQEVPQFDTAKFLKLFRDNIEVHPGDQWHVISSKWFQKWLGYINMPVQDDLNFPFPENQTSEDPGRISNADIIESRAIKDPSRPSSEYLLKYGIQESIDYVLLPKTAFNYLQEWYGCLNDIQRRAIEVNDAIYQVEVFLRKLNVILFNSRLEEFVFQVSRKDTVNEVKSKIASAKGLSGKLRVWKLSSVVNDKLVQFSNHHNHVHIQDSILLKEDLLIDDSDISPEDIILIELMKDGKFYISEDPSVVSSFCGYCQGHLELNIVCQKCKTARYCGVVCMNKDQRTHSATCKKPEKKRNFFQNFMRLWMCCTPASNEPQTEPVSRPVKIPSSDSGLVGLQNLGNTCFMNSALQCLSYTSELTSYFLDESYKRDVNVNNPLGFKGKLAQAYSDVLVSLWTGASSSVAPWKFKKVLAQINQQFHGFQQHDAHELLIYLLDGLHEDLNLVKKKPYFSDDVKSDGRSDDSVAAEFWDRHLARNRSVIVELMHGQYKSTVYCPRCQNNTYAYDPFCSVSLPIPVGNSKPLSIYYVSKDPNELPLSFTIEGDFIKVGDLRESVVNAIGRKNTQFFYVAVYFNTFKSFLSLDDSLADNKLYKLFAFEVSEKDFDKHPVEVQMVTGINTFAFPRLVFVKESYKEIHLKVFKKMHVFIEQFEKMKTGLNMAYQKQLSKPFYGLYFVTDRMTVCSLCNNKHCKGCEVPYSDSRPNFSEKSHLKVMVKLPPTAKTIGIDLYSMKQCNEIRKTQKRLKTVQLYECFRQFNQPETLDKSNSWYCPRCKVHVEAIKTMEIFKAPRVLAIQLKRFKVRDRWREKLTSPVEFPEKGLDISEFVLHNSHGIYDLYAVVNHYGNLGGGHYIAQCFNEKKQSWIEFNDSRVAETSELSSTAAYILFYRLRE